MKMEEVICVCCEHVVCVWSTETGRGEQGGLSRQHHRRISSRQLHRAVHQEPVPGSEGQCPSQIWNIMKPHTGYRLIYHETHCLRIEVMPSLAAGKY